MSNVNSLARITEQLADEIGVNPSNNGDYLLPLEFAQYLYFDEFEVVAVSDVLETNEAMPVIPTKPIVRPKK